MADSKYFNGPATVQYPQFQVGPVTTNGPARSGWYGGSGWYSGGPYDAGNVAYHVEFNAGDVARDVGNFFNKLFQPLANSPTDTVRTVAVERENLPPPKVASIDETPPDIERAPASAAPAPKHRGPGKVRIYSADGPSPLDPVATPQKSERAPHGGADAQARQHAAPKPHVESRSHTAPAPASSRQAEHIPLPRARPGAFDKNALLANPASFAAFELNNHGQAPAAKPEASTAQTQPAATEEVKETADRTGLKGSNFALNRYLNYGGPA